jgi:hypothetical protein
MRERVDVRVRTAAAVLLCAGAVAVAGAYAQEPAKPQVKIPEPGVPQIMTMEGRYVRVAYNNEGYAILGYKLANLSVGEEWMLLEFGVALRAGQPDYRMKREALSLTTPDGKELPLPTVEEYRQTNLSALQAREKVQRDSINYFPPNAHRACRIGFFADLEDRALPWDAVDFSNQMACLGRLYFKIPGKIAYGQYWLNVKFPQSTIRVPFRILTKEEDKFLDKNYKDIEKQVEEAFKPKKK